MPNRQAARPGGDWEQCAIRRMNGTMRLYLVCKCGRGHNGGTLAGALEERRRGDQGPPPKTQPLPTPSGYPVVVLMASLTLRGFRIRAATGVPAGSGAVLRVVRAGIAYSETVMASLT